MVNYIAEVFFWRTVECWGRLGWQSTVAFSTTNSYRSFIQYCMLVNNHWSNRQEGQFNFLGHEFNAGDELLPLFAINILYMNGTPVSISLRSVLKIKFDCRNEQLCAAWCSPYEFCPNTSNNIPCKLCCLFLLSNFSGYLVFVVDGSVRIVSLELRVWESWIVVVYCGRELRVGRRELRVVGCESAVLPETRGGKRCCDVNCIRPSEHALFRAKSDDRSPQIPY